MDLIPESSMWLLYLTLFIGPFVQEDTAVVAAASVSVSGSEHWFSIFIVILAGLVASDSWKYWLGWAATKHKWAKKYSEKDSVVKMKRAVVDHSVKSLFVARFIPFARIPTYLASGFFGVPYHVYWLSIAASAFLFVAFVFSGFHILGEIMGEHLKTYMPLVALGIAICIVGTIIYKIMSAKLKANQDA